MEEVVRSGDSVFEAESEGPAVGDSSDDLFGPPGTQTLVGTSADVDPLSVLPKRAYDNLLVVAARDHPSKLQRRLERQGHDATNVGVVPAAPASSEYGGDLWTTDPVSPKDLTGIGMRFSDAIQHVECETGWVLVDALGVLLMYSKQSRVCRFFQTLTSRVRTRDVNGAYCANPAAIDDETYEQLRAMCDGEFEIG